MLGSIWMAFGHVFYMQDHAVGWFMVCAVLLGLGGANFAVYSFWLPEQYANGMPRTPALRLYYQHRTLCRRGFYFSGRRRHPSFPNFGSACRRLTALAFIVGIALLPLGEETKGKSLPV